MILACRNVCAHRHDVGYEPVLSQYAHRIHHSRHLAEPAGDLSKLDAVPPELHLLVDPAHELDRSVGQPATEVACPVHSAELCPVAFRLVVVVVENKRVGHKAAASLEGPVVVAQAHLTPRDAQLARHAHGQKRSRPSVDNVAAQTGQGPADGARPFH